MRLFTERIRDGNSTYFFAELLSTPSNLSSIRNFFVNKEIRRRCGVIDITEKVREARLRYGHLARRDETEPIRDIMELETKGNRGRGRPKKNWMDCVKGLNVKELTANMTRGRKGLRTRIRAADPGVVWD